MKKRLLIWMTVMSMVVLAGCGSTEQNADNTGDTQEAFVETTQQTEDTQSANTESQEEAFVSDMLVIASAGRIAYLTGIICQPDRSIYILRCHHFHRYSI